MTAMYTHRHTLTATHNECWGTTTVQSLEGKLEIISVISSFSGPVC